MVWCLILTLQQHFRYSDFWGVISQILLPLRNNIAVPPKHLDLSSLYSNKGLKKHKYHLIQANKKYTLYTVDQAEVFSPPMHSFLKTKIRQKRNKERREEREEKRLQYLF